MSINARHQSLGSSFLISGGSINLSGKEKIFNILKFKGSLQLSRVEIVVFDRIGRTINFDILKAPYIPQSFELNLKRQRRGETLQVIFISVTPFRFQKKLVFRLVGKCPELVFNARAIAGTDAGNLSGK